MSADELREAVGKIIKTPWRIREGQDVPDDKDVALLQDGVRLDAVVLYSDLVGSSAMIQSHSQEFSAEVIKSFLLCATKIIHANGGWMTSYDGDRVMGVFVTGGKNTNAAKAALQITYAVSQIIVPLIRGFYVTAHNDFTLRHTTGIDASPVLAARAGQRGASDLVWIGKAATFAAHLSEVRDDFSTHISDAVYNSMLDEAKYSAASGENMWREGWTNWQGGAHRYYRSMWYWKP